MSELSRACESVSDLPFRDMMEFAGEVVGQLRERGHEVPDTDMAASIAEACQSVIRYQNVIDENVRAARAAKSVTSP